MSTTLKVFEASADDLEKFSCQVNLIHMSKASQTVNFFSLKFVVCILVPPRFMIA